MLKPFLTLSVRLKISVGSIAEEKMGVDNTDEFASKVTSDHVFKDLDADDLNRSVFYPAFPRLLHRKHFLYGYLKYS